MNLNKSIKLLVPISNHFIAFSDAMDAKFELFWIFNDGKIVEYLLISRLLQYLQDWALLQLKGFIMRKERISSALNIWFENYNKCQSFVRFCFKNIQHNDCKCNRNDSKNIWLVMNCDSFRQPDQHFVKLSNSSDGLVMVQRLCWLIVDLLSVFLCTRTSICFCMYFVSKEKRGNQRKSLT